MRLLRLHVENFRALESLDADLHPMTVIIGENDVGKTSCMLAIQTMFERRKIDDKADFFMHKVEREIVIEATFSCDVPTDAQTPYVDAHGRLSAKCVYVWGENRSTLVKCAVPQDERLRELDKQGVVNLRQTLKDLGLNPEPASVSKADAKRMLHEYITTNREALKFDESWCMIKEPEFGKLIPDFVSVPATRDIESHLRMTDTSLSGRLFRPLLREVLATETASRSLDDISKKLKAGVAERVERLELLMREQLNNPSILLRHEVELDALKGVTFEFGMDDERAKGIPIANRGAGVRNNLILSMFRLLGSYGAKDFILAIEEPEISLHPRGQREMLWALQNLARTAQVICRTHSTIFLDLGRLENNIVLTRTSKGNAVPRSFCADDPESLRDLLGIRVSDALLGGGGNCAIIVEGPTELGAYPHFFRMAGHDSRALGISLVNAEGCDKDRIRRLVMVLNTYGIPTFVVLDKDAEKTAVDLARFGPGGPLGCLREVFLLTEGSFETYIPLDISIAVMNELFLEGEEIREEDIDADKDRQQEFQRVLYQKKGPGARFEHFKVEFGELAGRKLLKEGRELPAEIKGIVDKVAAAAARS